MKPILVDLLRLLELERIEDNIFRGPSVDLGGERVFGGQVLGQALTAASYTAGAREVHSLHAYFLLPGDMEAPIVYEVDVARDGKSFSTRRVVAIQHGRPIFNMAASFQVAGARARSLGRDAGRAGTRGARRRSRGHARGSGEGARKDAALPEARAAVRDAAGRAGPDRRAASRGAAPPLLDQDDRHACPTIPTCTATCSRTCPTISSW